MSAGIAAASPAAVVMSALDIPPANTAALPVPSPTSSANTSIMPMTVPSSPNSGLIEAMVPSAVRWRSISCRTGPEASAMASFMRSRRRSPPLRSAMPAARIRANGRPPPKFARLSGTAASRRCARRHASATNPSGATRVVRSAQARSRQMATATMLQSRIGAMSQPPDCTSSSTCASAAGPARSVRGHRPADYRGVVRLPVPAGSLRHAPPVAAPVAPVSAGHL